MELSRCVLGPELGSTRIKAVLINENHQPIASGSFAWENNLENGVWTYPLEKALPAAYALQKEPGETLEDYLTKRVFSCAKSICLQPDPAGVADFQSYLQRYKTSLPVQKAASSLQ